jgi:hypothetical protein
VQFWASGGAETRLSCRALVTFGRGGVCPTLPCGASTQKGAISFHGISTLANLVWEKNVTAETRFVKSGSPSLPLPPGLSFCERTVKQDQDAAGVFYAVLNFTPLS